MALFEVVRCCTESVGIGAGHCIGVAIFVANAIRARLPDQSDFLSVENCVAICNATFATASLKS